MTTSDCIGSPRDFDFLVGDWTVHNRRLRRRHVACTDWDEFGARSRAWSLLGGVVSVDEIDCSARGFSGCSFRTLDREARRWSIHWVNSQSGVLFPPVVGGFAGPRGEFHGDDIDDGRPVRARFVWTVQDADHARWEQAFSLDGSAWETNWVMEMVRLQAGDMVRQPAE